MQSSTKGIKNKSKYFSKKSLRAEVMASFEERLYENNLDCFHFIQSKFADKLNYNEKLLFLYEMELDDVLYVDEEGNVKEVKKQNEG